RIQEAQLPIMQRIEVLVFTFQISQIVDGVYFCFGHSNRTKPFVMLLFSQSYGVRHRLQDQISIDFEWMMESPEKPWRACKRGALPTEL
ncbi:hypothetical protein M569_00079, partial [Genlisea aurea]